MTYRDEKEMLRARVAELEQELARKEDVIARLTGVEGRANPGDRIEHGSLLGGPSRMHLVRELDFEINERGFEEIAAFLRRQPGGTVTQVGRTLTVGALGAAVPGFSLTSRDGKTRIEVSQDLRILLWGAISGSLLSGGFVGMAAFAIAHDFFWRQLAEGHFLWIAPLFIAMAFPLWRSIGQRAAARSLTHGRATLEGVIELAHRHKKAPPQVRVEAEEEAAVEEEHPRAEAQAANR